VILFFRGRNGNERANLGTWIQLIESSSYRFGRPRQQAHSCWAMHKSFFAIKIDSEYKDAGSRTICLGNHGYIAEHPLVECKLCLDFDHFPFALPSLDFGDRFCLPCPQTRDLGKHVLGRLLRSIIGLL
jgi:hypothetical protein